MRHLNRLTRFLTACATVALLAPSAYAITFEEALSSAYEHNPRIKQERERLQATDELLNQATAGFRPTIGANYDRGRQSTSFNGGPDTDGNYTNKGITVEQPLFRGGGTISSLNSARQRVKAGQYDLMAVEQQVLLDAVTAYMDVVSASSILELSRANEKVLTEQMNAVNTRFQVGEVTRTDVAQSQARTSDARSSVIAAEGQLISALATYERVIGYRPSGELAIPTRMPELPPSLNVALEQGRATAPVLQSAIHNTKSALYDVRTNKATILPRVSLVGAMSRDSGAGTLGTSKFDQDRIGVAVAIPLYQSGAEYSRVREAKALARQRDQIAIDTRQAVDQAITQGWERLETALATITTRQDQIKAAETALEGVKQENEFGVRTVLDVLDAEQELFSARTNLVRADRDRIVAAYNLSLQMGRLRPELVGIRSVTYDPQEHADEVEWKFIGLGD